MTPEFWSEVFKNAFLLFMVLDPPGNVGPVASLLAPYDFRSQQRILRRELMIALTAMVLFYLGGSYFIDALDIQTVTVEITGGIVFGFVGIGILFPPKVAQDAVKPLVEPFIVPIAVPLIAGPSCLAVLITFSQTSTSTLSMFVSIVIAWAGSAVFVLAAPFLARIVGKSGLRVAEQGIGVICVFLALQTILNGFAKYAAHLGS